ncbi:hypothetical protein DES52_110128 [Deinococcus yavapaiensis KR-236]|uniref:Uncharacterized protein n=1 Tax=Deinococcus yavapaiensis KR-236 TaxID=694435 RepID=A0A318SA87_9DEIO|nr:hypothetical protein DES52_110128 [Deinococcus yavapaiensis KR-236]
MKGVRGASPPDICASAPSGRRGAHRFARVVAHRLGSGAHAELRWSRRRPQTARGIPRRSALLVLDNLEHLLDAAAEFVDGLLATSRAPLRLSSEHKFTLGPLALPSQGLELDALEPVDASGRAAGAREEARPRRGNGFQSPRHLGRALHAVRTGGGEPARAWPDARVDRGVPRPERPHRQRPRSVHLLEAERDGATRSAIERGFA